MKDRYEIDFSDNPIFNSVSGLTNTTLNLENIVVNRGATEGQLRELYNLLISLQTQIDECCAEDHSQATTDDILARLDDLEARIEGCCNRNPYEGGGGGCDGNVITVSFGWNGDPFTDGGQATAVSADSSRQIVAYYFLVYDNRNSIYRRSSTAFGGDWVWSISSTGSVTASHAGAVGPGNELIFAKEIIAVDSQGCEGGTPISLPISHAVGG